MDDRPHFTWVCSLAESTWISAIDLVACAATALSRGASDVHVVVGSALGVRVGGKLFPCRGWNAPAEIGEEWRQAAGRLRAFVKLGPMGFAVDTPADTAPNPNIFREVDPPTSKLAALILLFRGTDSSEQPFGDNWDHVEATLRKVGAFDWSATVVARLALRSRISAQVSRTGLSLCLRSLPDRARDIESLGFGRDTITRLKAAARRDEGFVLCCGSVNSGKSATISSMVAYGNTLEGRKVVTNEDPVELPPTKFGSAGGALTQQREIGADVPSFVEAIRQAFRADADCLVLGEIRDRASMMAALEACQGGHLVYATMHAGSFLDALDRIGRFFPPNEREMGLASFARNLAAFVYQSLLPTLEFEHAQVKAEKNSAGRLTAYEDLGAGIAARSRRLAYEYVEGTPDMRTLIRRYAIAPGEFRLSSFSEVIQRAPHTDFLMSLAHARDALTDATFGRAQAGYEATLPSGSSSDLR